MRASAFLQGTCFVLLLLALPCGAEAQPSVPTLTGRVVDEADILSVTTERTLTTLLAAHEDSTSNQVAVLTVPSLEGYSIESYAIEVAEEWALGTAERDNGVLLLVAPAEREVRIEVGLGLEGTLTDIAASRIIRHDIVPRFREGDYDAGVLAGTRAVLGTIEGTYTPQASTYARESDPSLFLFGLAFMFIPSIFVLLSFMYPGGSQLWFIYFFLLVFFLVGGWGATGSIWGMLIVLGLFTLVYWGGRRLPFVRRMRDRHGGGQGGQGSGFSFSSGGSSSGWSSGSSFSGGGGSFGGGGASGSW